MFVPLLWKRPLRGWCTHPRSDFQLCSIHSDHRFSFLNAQRGSQDAWRDRTVAMTLQLHILVRVGLFLCAEEIHIITVQLPESSRIRSIMYILPAYCGQNEKLALQHCAKYGWVQISTYKYIDHNQIYIKLQLGKTVAEPETTIQEYQSL